MARKLTQKEFIERCINKHGTAYTYTDAVYKGSRKKVSITCSMHGNFQQQAGAHLNGQGCPDCAGYGNYRPGNYLSAVEIKHRNKFKYTFPLEMSADTRLDIECPVHGIFNQRASSHLEGVGCRECMYDAKAKTFDEYSDRANSVHSNKYVYLKDLFDIRSPEVTIRCRVHGQFTSNKGNHLQGHGCPKCYIPGYSVDKPGTLYYLKITTATQTVWKIGITNRTIDERFTAKDLKVIEVLYQHTFTDGQEAKDLETTILINYKKIKYTGNKILHSGNTELFTEDIFLNDLDVNKLIK